jgi:hypothetical protein
MPVVTKRVQKWKTTQQLKKVGRLDNAKGFVGFNAGQNIFYPDGKALWQVAEDNEFGTINDEGFYIPSRPFMKETFNKNRDEYGEMMRTVAKKFLEGSKGARLNMVSMLSIIKSDLQEAILTWDTPPNAPMTIQKKGFDDPLIDTKTMLNNVTYWIDNKGGEND